MPDTLTANLQFTNQSEGGNDNTWGIKTDDNWELLDDKLGDLTTVTTTGGTTVLTDDNQDVAAIKVNGTLVSNATIEFDGRGGFWIVWNNTSGDFSVTCKLNGQTGVAIPQGTFQLVWCDGTDIRLGNTDPAAAGEVTVASAGTTNILGAGSEFVAVSGTATITSFGTGASVKRYCRATGAFTITHNASSLICPGGGNIVAAAGDTFIVISDASSNARIVMYQRAAAPPAHVPIGQVTDFAGSTAPAFWLLCYGQAVSRTTYAALFAVLSTTYGSGDGSTTFNLPDLRGRVVAGKDDMGGSSANRLTDQSGGLNGDSLGAAGGAETHTLSEAQIAGHTHSFSATTSENGAHDHTFDGRIVAGGGADSGSGLLYNQTGTTSSNGAHTHTVSGTTGSTGSGSAHNNVQPTIVLNKIIFAGV